MVKVMYNKQLVYKVVIWAFDGISLWKEKAVSIKTCLHSYICKLSAGFVCQNFPCKENALNVLQRCHDCAMA